MEPPAKRRKTAAQKRNEAEEDEDELFLEPEELNQRRDPAFQLQKGRALAVNKLKSRFEDIFAKYEKDFTGVGDEIDLSTGEVVVDNGHLESMRIARDSEDSEEDRDDENGQASEDERRILQGQVNTGSSADAALATVRRDPWQVAGPSWPPLAMENTPRLSSMMFPGQQPFMSPFLSTPPFGMSTPMVVDPTWHAPELPISSFADHSANAAGRKSGQRTWTTTRKMARKYLPAPESIEADEEDALLGVSGNLRKTKESPLIKERFPVISSPHEDPSLSEFIQEVIQENLPETSPSNRISQTPLRPRGQPSILKQDQPALAASSSEKRRRGRSKGWRKTSADQAQDSMAVDSTVSSGSNPKEQEGLQNGQSHTEKNDLRSSTLNRPQSNKPSNQVLYVEIKMSKQNSDFIPIREDEDSSTSDIDKDKDTIPRKPIVQGKMERIVMDPSFNFSDEDTLLPRKARKRRQTEPVTIPAAAAAATTVTGNDDSSDPKPKSDGPALERIALDPTFAFSDEENMPPRPSRRKARMSEPARLLDAGRATRPKTAIDTSRPRRADLPQSHTKPKASRTTKTRQSCAPSTDVLPSATPADIQIESHIEAASLAQPELSTAPSPPKQHQQYQEPEPDPEPTTPNRPKVDKIPHSTNTGIISLLSDNEDEEDEISFDLADFTPSGHHRILVHRPFPHLTNSSFSFSNKNTPATNLTNTNKKKKNKNKTKRASLLFPSSVPPSSRNQETTPNNNNKHHSHSNSKTRKTQLARSVVKVHHHHNDHRRRRHTDIAPTTINRKSSNRLPSPTGSIVQTPGGTKRRCGEGDFRCERDFCFVCM